MEKYIESSGWSVGVSFFMSDMIDAALKGESLSDIVEAGIREDPLLNSLIDLAESDHGMDIAANATYTGIEAIRAADQLFGSNDATIGGEALTLEDKIRSRFGVGETYDVKDADGNIIKEGGDFNPVWSIHVGTFNSEQRWTESTPSQINAGGEVTVIAGTDINLIGGTVVKGEGINLFAENDVNILSNEDRYSSDSNNFGIRVDFAGLVPVGGGVSYAGSDSDGTKHTHASLDAGSGILTLQSGGNTTISGADILGRELDFDIAGDYYVGSVQNTFTSDSNAFSIGGSPTSATASFASSEANRNFTDQVTSVIGTEKVDIKVGGHTHVKGSIIAQGYMDESGQWNTEDNLLLQTSTISFEDIHDSDKSKSFSLGGSYGGLKGEGNTAIPGVVDGSYESAYKEGITKATIGGGEIIITDPEAQAELATEIVSTKTAIEAGEEVEQPELAKQFTNIEDLNRDVTDVQIITRDEETYIRAVVPIVDGERLDEVIKDFGNHLESITKELPSELRPQGEAVEHVWREGIRNGLTAEQATALTTNMTEEIAINTNLAIASEFYGGSDNIPPQITDAILSGYTPHEQDGKLYLAPQAVDSIDLEVNSDGTVSLKTEVVIVKDLPPIVTSDQVIASKTDKEAEASSLKKHAQHLQDISESYIAFEQEYPGATDIILTTLTIGTQTLTGLFVGGPAGALAGGINAIKNEVAGRIVGEIAEEKIAEIMNSAVDEAADLFQEQDRTLARSEARTLGAYSLMGGAILTQGTIGAKHLLKISSKGGGIPGSTGGSANVNTATPGTHGTIHVDSQGNAYLPEQFDASGKNIPGIKPILNPSFNSQFYGGLDLDGWNYNSSTGEYISPGGLVYGNDNVFGNRIDHVLDHTNQMPLNPNKPSHTVFNTSTPNETLNLIDEAWSKTTDHVPGDSAAWVVDMGNIVGTNGETSIRLVVEPGTNNIITAYPY